MRRQPHQPVGRRRELRAAEQFPADFPIAAVPTIRSHHLAQHVAIRKADQCQIVVLLTAKYLEAGGRARVEAQGLDGDENLPPVSPCQIPAAGEAKVTAGREVEWVTVGSDSAPHNDGARAIPMTIGNPWLKYLIYSPVDEGCFDCQLQFPSVSGLHGPVIDGIGQAYRRFMARPGCAGGS